MIVEAIFRLGSQRAWGLATAYHRRKCPTSFTQRWPDGQHTRRINRCRHFGYLAMKSHHRHRNTEVRTGTCKDIASLYSSVLCLLSKSGRMVELIVIFLWCLPFTISSRFWIGIVFLYRMMGRGEAFMTLSLYAIIDFSSDWWRMLPKLIALPGALPFLRALASRL